MAPPNVKIKHITRSPSSSGDTRFPKLDECAHFHYENVELGPIKVLLCDKATESNKLASVCSSSANKENEVDRLCFLITVISNSRKWMVRRSYKNFMFLDTQLHRCVYDRKYSLLKELPNVSQEEFDNTDLEESIRTLLSEYLERFSQLAGSLINCGPVLNWFELDNRGNRLIVTDEVAINTPAVAAAYVVVPYSAQATDEISFDSNMGTPLLQQLLIAPGPSTSSGGPQASTSTLKSKPVGDMISVIDMPPPEESSWWRGKKGFEVGFFPSECVEVIGDKVPNSFKLSNASTKPVFRRHGKLIAFFRSFLLSRPSRRKLKQSGILKERVFGCDLGEHLLNTGREIPMVLKCCAEFIEEYGVVDGIYRLSGVSSNIQRLRLAFDEDRPLNLGDPATVHDIHSVASLLKMYFRELPNPLLTYQLYDKFVSAVQSSEDVRLLRVRDVVRQLPPPHFRTLQYLLCHLAKIASHGDETGMTPKNIAIVWAPNLLRSRDVENGGVGALHVVGVQAVLTEYLIRFYELIFDEKVPSVPSGEQGEGFMLKARPKSLAISTPTKLLSLEEARARALSTHLPLTQQKYIEVGGGPDKLPSKYHTVIDLPSGKQGLPKLKKSPSGWKSFFSRGWYSGSTRDKSRHAFRTSRKASTGSLPHPSGYMQEKPAADEADAPYGHRKKLRTVKSAESLVHCLKESPLCPNRNEIGVSSQKSSPQVSVDSSGSSGVISPISKSPGLQKHTRSSSHESYFESNSMDIISEPSFEEDEHGLFYYVSEQMRMLQNSSSLPWDSDNTQCIMPSENQDEQKMEGINEADSVEIEKSTRKQKSTSIEDFANAKVQKLNETSSESDEDSSTIHFQKESFVNDAPSSNYNGQRENVSELSHEDEGLTIDPMLLYDAILNKRSSAISSSDTDTDVNNRTIVERYGNAETVLVEVHATQDSSSEEEQSSNFIDENSKLETEVHLSDEICEESNLIFDSVLEDKPLKDLELSDISVESPSLKSHSPMLFDDVSLTLIKDESSPELSETSSSNSDISNEFHNLSNSNIHPFDDAQNIHSPSETQIIHSPNDTREILSPKDTQSTLSPNETQSILSPNETQSILSPKETQSILSPKETQSIFSPNETQSILSPNETQSFLSSNETQSILSPNETQSFLSSNETQSILSPNETQSILSPNETQSILSPNETQSILSPNDTQSLPAQCVQSPNNTESIQTQEIVSPLTEDIVCDEFKDIKFRKDRAKLIFEEQLLNKDFNLMCEKETPSHNKSQALDTCHSFSINTPPSPVYPPKSLKLQDFQSLKTKMENIPIHKKKHIIIPSPSSPVEEVRKKFELHASNSKKSSEFLNSEVRPRTQLKDWTAKSKASFESQENVSFVPPNSEKLKQQNIESPATENISFNKRHSEPPPKTEAASPTDVPKRMSNKYESEISQVPKSAEKTSKPKTQQPSLFTQLKIRKLQSLQSEVTGPPPEPIDPWSDPILDLQEDYHPMIYSPSHKIKSVDNSDSDPSDDQTKESEKDSQIENPPEDNLTENQPSEMPLSNNETKMDVTSDLPAVESKNITSTVSEVDSQQGTCKPTEAAPESEAVKRERINRIKEERRAQLREKLKPESFRLEAEEKEKVQTKFRLRKDCRYGSTEDNSKDVKKSDKAVETDSADITETGVSCDLSSVSDESISKAKSSDKLGIDFEVSNKPQKDVSKTSDSHHKAKKSAHSYDDRKWLSMPQTDIRDKVAMFERSKETKELCRLGPNGKFIQKQSPSALTSSFVR